MPDLQLTNLDYRYLREIDAAFHPRPMVDGERYAALQAANDRLVTENHSLRGELKASQTEVERNRRGMLLASFVAGIMTLLAITFLVRVFLEP